MVKEYLISLGYSNDEAETILNSYSLNKLKEDTLLIHIKSNYNFFIIFGYSHKDILKMTMLSPALYDYSIENLEKKIEYLLSLGYSKDNIIKMTKAFPSLYGYSIENIKRKIEDLISLGYNKADIIKMTKLLPVLYGLSIENIKQRINDLISLGYSREDVIKMTKQLSTLYGYTIENIKLKVEFFKRINLGFIMVYDTKRLMQSIDLTYARYMFFKNQGIVITEENYTKLFYSTKNFEKQYGIDKSALLEKYNFQEYINNKNKGEKNGISI